MSFLWTRRQFPIMPCFGMTIKCVSSKHCRDTASNTSDKQVPPMDTVRCSGSAADANGHSEMQRLEWSASKAETLQATQVAPMDTVQCSCSVADAD